MEEIRNKFGSNDKIKLDLRFATDSTDLGALRLNDIMVCEV